MITRRNAVPHWAVPLLLLGAWLRFRWLDLRALWFDEGVSLTFARMPLRDVPVYSNLWVDTNPPAYRVLLGGWIDLAGANSLSARFLSALLGLLAMAATYRIGRMLGLHHRSAAFGALILTLLPMQVYYSREAKGYTLIQICLLATILIWLTWFRGEQRQSAASTAAARTLLAAGLAAYTGIAFGAHYIAALLPITMSVWTLVWMIGAWRHQVPRSAILRQSIRWYGAQLIGALAWLPWVLATADAAAAGSQAAAANIGLAPRNPITYLAEMALEFASGPSGPLALRWVAAGVLIGLAGIGLLRLSALRSAQWMLGSWLAVPLLLGFGIQFALPFFYPRFLMYITPALALLAGCGLMTLEDLVPRQKPALRAGWGLVAATLAGLLGWLAWNTPRLPGPEIDLRPLAQDLAAEIRTGDALIYSYHWQPGMLGAYLPPDRQPAMYPSFFEEGQRDAAMQRILERHERVWLLTYRIGADDPINDVGLWLLAHAGTPGGVWYGDSQLNLFLSPQQAINSGAATECETFDGGRIELCYAPLPAEAGSRSPVVIALQWRAHEPLAERYVVFVHLLGAESPVPVAQQDVQPANGMRPTYSWTPGEAVADLHAIHIPPEAAAAGNQFEIVVGLYDADTLERVPADNGGDSVRLGQVTLLSPP